MDQERYRETMSSSSQYHGNTTSLFPNLSSTHPECAEVVDQQADDLCGYIGNTSVQDVLGMIVKGNLLCDLHRAKHEGELRKEEG